MIALALKLELLVPLVKSRCAACGRLFRRGTVCRCARQSRD
jgi:hypothetical protein